MQPPVDGKSWGSWTFDLKTLTLAYKGEHRYEVRLDEISDSAEMLDWLMQLQMKTWTTTEDIGQLVHAFYELFRPQQTLCGGGKDHTLNAKQFFIDRYGSEAGSRIT